MSAKTRTNTVLLHVQTQTGRPFVSKLWHDIRAVFSHVYLQSFLPRDIRAFFCHVYLRFIPKYMTIFLQTRIYMRTKKPIYMRYKQACGICGRRKSSYKRYRIIPSARNPLHVRWSRKVTSVWIKHGRNGRVNFEQDLVLIHCPHRSGGCWLPHNSLPNGVTEKQSVKAVCENGRQVPSLKSLTPDLFIIIVFISLLNTRTLIILIFLPAHLPW